MFLIGETLAPNPLLSRKLSGLRVPELRTPCRLGDVRIWAPREDMENFARSLERSADFTLSEP